MTAMLLGAVLLMVTSIIVLVCVITAVAVGTVKLIDRLTHHDRRSRS